MGAVIAIDPGKTVGIAWVDYPPTKIDSVAGRKLLSLKLNSEGSEGDVLERSMERKTLDGKKVVLSEFDVVEGLLNTIQAVDMSYELEAIVIEDFVLRKFSMARDLLAPVRITAMLEYGLNFIGMGELVVKQPPSDMGVITDDRLRDWGLWVKGKPHGRAAVKHLVAYLRRSKES